MRARRRPLVIPLVMLAALATAPAAGAGATKRSVQAGVAERVMAITRKTEWKLVASIPLLFPSFHPQGMVKIGSDFYLSSVELPAQAKTAGAGGREAAAGVGHLFKFGAGGALLADIRLGEGLIYHPGGVDYDGRAIWVPVSEYRPDSHAIVYTVDPATMTAQEAFRFGDHIGAVAFDRDRRTLLGLSWGSRRIYRWRLGGGRRHLGEILRATSSKPNRLHYIDYQDCHFVGANRVLCSGLADEPGAPGGPRFQLGGLELLNLQDDRPVWQAPSPCAPRRAGS